MEYLCTCVNENPHHQHECSCFMFRSKRSNLVKRLWKLRVEKNESSREDENSSDVTKSVAHSMLKRLREPQLDSLLKSIEGRGLVSTECVMIPKELLRLGKRTVRPHVLCCQLWRWPELNGEHAMKRLHECKSANDTTSICCNPYHWSRLILPDTPPPPYKVSIAESSPPTKQGDVVSTETGLTPTAFHQIDGDNDGGGVGSSSSSMTSCWCHVAYWELRERVGPLFSVHDSCVRVFQHLPQAAGMCLAQMQPDTTSSTSRTTSGSGDDVTRNNDVIMRVRDKIGAGVTLSLEEDGTHVWLYNRCDYPVFVNSPTLELPNSRTTVVKKVPPGYSLQIFDFERSEMLECVRDPQLYQDGPYDPHSIRISFAKGWGPHYSRQFITSCPCWIEVLLRINR